MEVHRNLDTNLKYVCKICGSQYGRSFALNDHLKTAHEGMSNETVEHYLIEAETPPPAKEDNPEVYSVVLMMSKK